MFVLILCLTAGSCSPPAEHPAPGTPYVEWLGEWGDGKEAERSEPQAPERHTFYTCRSRSDNEGPGKDWTQGHSPEVVERIRRWREQNNIDTVICEAEDR